jgi:hypothetical protein
VLSVCSSPPCVSPGVLPMADGSKKTSTFSRMRTSLKMKDKSKAGKDPPDVTRSSAAAAVAQPKGKRSSKDKKEEKKREKSRRSSSKSSVESPPSGSVRDSFILQSPSVLAVEDRLQHGSPPGGEESALSGNSSGATRGELFTDDPLRVEVSELLHPHTSLSCECQMYIARHQLCIGPSQKAQNCSGCYI